LSFEYEVERGEEKEEKMNGSDYNEFYYKHIKVSFCSVGTRVLGENPLQEKLRAVACTIKALQS
jgi:hypothetical protein